MKSDFEENFFLFFLTQIKGLSNRTIYQFLSQEKLDKKIKKLIDSKLSDNKFVEKTKSDFAKMDENYLTIFDNDYPPLLRKIYDPPLFLFYRGNKKLLQKNKMLTIVGSRTLTNYHQSITKKLLDQLKDTDISIVSGLAIGIDGLAHSSALENNLATIAVLGSGLDDSVLYPQTNLGLAHAIIDKGGLLISEYPKYSRPKLHYFPRRNRILAGLSKITLVISGALKSGTLITAQVALDEGRDVYALPGNINQRLNQGPNSLIVDGANVLISANEILKKFGINKKIVSKKILFKNNLHAKIYSTLQIEPLTLEQLAKKLDKSPADLNVFISELEIRDLIKVNRFNQLEIL